MGNNSNDSMMANMRSQYSNDEIAYDEAYGDYYNYDYNVTYTVPEHLPLDEVIPVATVYGLIGLLGLVGNVLVIFAIARLPRMRSITNMFLLSLASADLLLVCVCVPVKGVAFYSYSWKLGMFLCKFVHYVQAVSIICSASTLTVMSIERFVAIRHPLKARSMCTLQHARMVIIGTWTFSFVAAIPMVFAIEYRTVGLVRQANWCHKYYTEKPLFGQIYELYMLTVVLLVPVGVMVVTYTWIANIIWHVASRRADMRSGSCVSNVSGGDKVSSGESQVKPIIMSPLTGQSTKAYMDDDRTRKQVVMMLMVVVLLFVVCWTPILVNNVLVAFELLDYLHMGYLKELRIAFHIMSYSNSCVNPFVYAFMSKNFRDGFKQSICACVKGDGYLRRQQTSLARSVTSTTRASTSLNGDKYNSNRFDSIAVRRPSDMEELEIRRLM